MNCISRSTSQLPGIPHPSMAAAGKEDSCSHFLEEQSVNWMLKEPLSCTRGVTQNPNNFCSLAVVTHRLCLCGEQGTYILKNKPTCLFFNQNVKIWMQLRLHQQLQVLLATLCVCPGEFLIFLITAVGLFPNNTPDLSRYSHCTLQICEQMKHQTLLGG